MSDREAGEVLGWIPSRVSARRDHLVKNGQVVDIGKQKDLLTNKTVLIWGKVKETLFD
jgi:hypothetical protein